MVPELPFSQMILQARNEKQLTQAELVRRIEERLAQRKTKIKVVTAAALSTWERGQLLPGGERGRLLVPVLAEILGLEPRIVAAALDQQKSSRDVSSPALGQEKFFAQIQERIESLGPENVELWLLAPTSLPVQHSEHVRDLWIKNLNNGMSYTMVWLPYFVPLDAPQGFQVVLEHIGSRINGSGAGCLNHIVLNDDSDGKFKELADLNDVDANPESFKYVLGLCGGVNKVTEVRMTQKVRNSLLLHWSSLGTIGVYCPRVGRETAFAPFCSFVIDNVALSPEHYAERRAAFFWLDPRLATRLFLAVKAIRANISRPDN